MKEGVILSTDIGKLISSRRKELNLTQEQLAQKLYVSRKVVSRWELNERIPNTMIVKDLCKVLNISIDEFFMGLNYSYEQRDKLYIIKVLKNIMFYGLLGSIGWFLILMLYFNFHNLMIWDELYTSSIWVSIFFSMFVSIEIICASFISCLIFYINHNNNINKRKINFNQLITIILFFIVITILLILYIILSINSFNNKNCILWLLYVLFLFIIPSISLIIIMKFIDKYYKIKYKKINEN